MRSALLVGIVGVLGLGACGDDGGSPGTADASTDSAIVDAAIDAAIDAPSAAFTLTSPTITNAMPIPVVHTCDGANTSPALAWTSPPAGTMSFAIIFTDKTNGLIHSVIYDIPASAIGLPANVQKTFAPNNVTGAHQTTAYDNNTRGYLGPCPPPADAAHIYELMLYALSVPTLPGGATMGTTKAQARTAILANDLAMVALTGTADR